jgi:hypothetical protein
MFNSLIQIIILLVFLFAIVAITKLFIKQKTQGEQAYPYEREPALFSPAERSFLGALEQVIDNRYRIMGKIRLADIVKVKNGLNKSDWQKAFNKIQNKHVDMVACDVSTLRVLFAVELDDKTHRQAKRQNRDQFVDDTLSVAGIPIVHFAAKDSYSLQEIENILSKAGVLDKP